MKHLSVPDEVWTINKDVPEEYKNLAFSTDERWWDQVDLIKLLLPSNKLTELSENISFLPALGVLDVSLLLLNLFTIKFKSLCI